MEKIYCGNARVKTTQYGEMMKISLSREDINKIANYAQSENRDWVNIEVKAKRTPEEGKPTHYLEIDQWKPDHTKAQPTATPAAPKAEPFPLGSGSQPDEDDLPF